ncbi:MAG: hypothetical protein RSF40_02170 [Oscillospiraceae bacterium]
MGIPISSAGVTVGYAVETTAGTKPVTGFIKIPDIKKVPNLNPSPSSLDTTILSETEYKTAINGLKDLGGALEFTANLTEELMAAWDTIMTTYTGLTAGKQMWIEIKHPKLAKSVFFKGEPTPIGSPEYSIDGVSEISLYIAPVSAPKWETKST